jgi:hypothetical protein
MNASLWLAIFLRVVRKLGVRDMGSRCIIKHLVKSLIILHKVVATAFWGTVSPKFVSKKWFADAQLIQNSLAVWTLVVYGDMIRTILAATWWTQPNNCLDELRKSFKISYWTVVDSTKSVSAELSDFGQWRQLKVESEIKSPWILKSIL